MSVTPRRDHRLRRGHIAYTSDQPDRFGQIRGREYFTAVRHADGSRTATAHCEIDDAPSVMRDIVFGVDEKWRPLDCSVRLSVGDRFTGSGWFRFDGAIAECESFTALEGRVSQTMTLEKPAVAFGTHAILTDAWLLASYDLAKGEGVQTVGPLLLPSPDHRGATGPMLFRVQAGIAFLGRERLTVAAGTFEALHFRFVSVPGLPRAHPDYDVWCSDDDNYLFLRGQVGGYMQTRYELVSLE